MATILQLRRGLASDWISNNPILASGEAGVETDTNKFKFGDGITSWTSLPYVGSGSDYELPTASTTTLGGVIVDGTSITILDGVISSSGSGTTDYDNLTDKPSINSVTLSGNKTSADLGLQPSGSYATTSNLSSHTSNTSNPHSVTKAQVDLSNVDNTSDANKPISSATQTALNLKVDKVSGKGLSTNDLTDTLKTNYDTAYTNTHTHNNKTILDNTTASFTSTLKTSYDGAVTKTNTIVSDGDGTKYLANDGIYKTVQGGGAVSSVNTKTGDVILTTADISDSTDKRYVTNAQQT